MRRLRNYTLDNISDDLRISSNTLWDNCSQILATYEVLRSAHPTHSGGPHLTLPAAGDRIDPLRADPRHQRAAPTRTAPDMMGQLGDVTLDVAEGDAAAMLVGSLEQVGHDQLAGFHDTHGQDRRPASPWMRPNTPSCQWTHREHALDTICA